MSCFLGSLCHRTLFWIRLSWTWPTWNRKKNLEPLSVPTWLKVQEPKRSLQNLQKLKIGLWTPSSPGYFPPSLIWRGFCENLNLLWQTEDANKHISIGSCNLSYRTWLAESLFTPWTHSMKQPLTYPPSLNAGTMSRNCAQSGVSL